MTNPEQIHQYNSNGTRYAVLSKGGPDEQGALNVLMQDGDVTPRDALFRFASECRAKSDRLLLWASRIDASLSSI